MAALTSPVWSGISLSMATRTPSSSMRRAQYRVPGAGGDAECVVFYFGLTGLALRMMPGRRRARA